MNVEGSVRTTRKKTQNYLACTIELGRACWLLRGDSPSSGFYAPKNFTCTCVYLSICLSIYLSIYLSVYLSIYVVYIYTCIHILYMYMRMYKYINKQVYIHAYVCRCVICIGLNVYQYHVEVCLGYLIVWLHQEHGTL